MNLWTTKLVRHFIYTRFCIAYCRERVRQLLYTLGVRLRRLRHGHLKAKAMATMAPPRMDPSAMSAFPSHRREER